MVLWLKTLARHKLGALQFTKISPKWERGIAEPYIEN